MSAVVSVNLIIHKGTDFETEFNLTEDDGSPLNLIWLYWISKNKKVSNLTKI
jgi:hypothetical protein